MKRSVTTTGIVFFSLLFLILSSGCAMKQDIFLNSDGSGKVDFEIKLAPYFAEVMDQLSELVPSEENQPKPEEGTFFNIPKLREDFSKRKGVSLTRLEAPSPLKLAGSFSFTDINTAVTDGGKTNNPGIFTFTRGSGGVSVLRVDINYSTLEALLAENPSMNNPLMENFGPLANRDITETDYLDMMEYMLGEESRKGITDSDLDLTIKVKGKIVGQAGGKITGSDSVHFKIPLLKILVLKEPLTYSVRFK